MTRVSLLAVAVVLIALEGYVHGVRTNRWGNARAIDEAVARLPEVPLRFGDWEGQARALPEREARQAGFAGHVLWTYQNVRDGNVVNVMLACGPAGPLSVHTPAVCYGGAGFAQAGEPARQGVEFNGAARPAEFWKAKFVKGDGAAPLSLGVCYGWHADGAWSAPASPRLTFAGQPVLHKLYVSYQLNGSDERQGDAVTAGFLAQFLPEVERSLFRAR